MLSRSFNHNVMGVSETDSYSQIIEAQAYEYIKLVLIYMNLKSIYIECSFIFTSSNKNFPYLFCDCKVSVVRFCNYNLIFSKIKNKIETVKKNAYAILPPNSTGLQMIPSLMCLTGLHAETSDSYLGQSKKHDQIVPLP